MASKPFPAKYENVCGKCGQKINVGDPAVFPFKGAEKIVHASCSPPGSSSGAGEPPGTPAAQTQQGGAASASPVGSSDAPIYTFHVKAFAYDQYAKLAYEIDTGISNRGRPATEEERAGVILKANQNRKALTEMAGGKL